MLNCQIALLIVPVDPNTPPMRAAVVRAAVDLDQQPLTQKREVEAEFAPRYRLVLADVTSQPSRVELHCEEVLKRAGHC